MVGKLANLVIQHAVKLHLLLCRPYAILLTLNVQTLSCCQGGVTTCEKHHTLIAKQVKIYTTGLNGFSFFLWQVAMV